MMDLYWLPCPQRITYKLCMIMFKCLHGSASAYLADDNTSTSLVPGRPAFRSAVHGDLVVPCHRTDWGSRSFAVTGLSSWNVVPVGLRYSSFSLHRFSVFTTGHALLSLYYLFIGCDKEIAEVSNYMTLKKLLNQVDSPYFNPYLR